MYRFPALLFLALLANPFHPAFAQEGDASFAVSPDSAYSLLTKAIAEAKSSIDMNIYMLTSRTIANMLVEKAEQGVKVRVLVEGEPSGGSVYPIVKQVLTNLNYDFRSRAPQNGELLVMTGNGNKAVRRYVFDHAKYVVIDHKTVFVSSDNFTGSAFPDNSKVSYVGGSRGWQVLVEDAALAGDLNRIFEQDISNPQDVVPFAKAHIVVSDPSGGSPLPPRKVRTVENFGTADGTARNAALCTSPRSQACVLDFIRSAKKDLEVEHLELPLYWKDGGKDQQNPIVTELLAAAARGVQVKVLVNDEKSFSDDDGDGGSSDKELLNSYLVAQLNKMAAQKHLPLQAALFDHVATQTAYVHNKGMIADGQRIFVSSINGTENSIENNREVAVALDSVDGARYFGTVFGFDWDHREQ
jgi:phosphatidylserine/phosphatidylglycerophosphate/cardiolipin synthase-like enzyme